MNPSSVAASPPAWARWATAAALATATVLAFGGVVRNGWFGIDDSAYVTENPVVARGLSAESLRWEWSHAWMGNYHPLTMTSHLADVSLFGMNPGAHHAVSLAWHVLAALLLLFVLHAYTGAWWRSAIVAALFAVHPLRTESIAWASERKDVLSAALFMLVLAAYRAWAARPSPGRMALVALALALGLLAKPMLVTAPLVLLALDAWPLGRLGFGAGARARGAHLAARVAEKWPLWLLAAAAAAGAYAAQGGAGALAIVPGLTFPMRACNALASVWIYAGQCLWPRHLVAYVPHTLRADWGPAAVALAALVAVTLAVLRARARPWLATGWLWWLVMLLPVINLVQVGPHARADRFTYLPSIGLALLVVWELGERARGSRLARGACAALAVAAIVALVPASMRQTARWRDTRTMYEWILEVNPGTTNVRWWLGDLYLQQGDPARALAMYERVLREAPGRAAQLRPRAAAALVRLGRDAEAREQLAAVVREAPAAAAWNDLGRFDARAGRDSLAAAELGRAAALAPADSTAHAGLAVALLRLGRATAALDEARRAVELAPGAVEYRRLYAETLRRAGRHAEALAQYEAIVARRPDDVNALLNAAWLRATLPDARDRDGAAALRMAALAEQAAGAPMAALAATRAAALAECGRFDEAAAAAERAIALARAANSPLEATDYVRQAALYRAHRPCREVEH